MNDLPEPSGVRLETVGPVARLTLTRPAQHNALEAEDVDSILGQLDRVQADDSIRVLVLTGAGDSTFCSGASLTQMESGEMDGARFDTLTHRLERLGVPSICRLNGNAYGGGVELALCCDFRVGVEGMSVSVPAARLGLCYPVGGISRYVRRLGVAAATRILLAAEPLDADELARIGFVTTLADRDDLDRVVDGLADHLASLAPLAVQGMKRILLACAYGSPDAAESEELVARCARSEDLAEGLSAWRERRPPKFRGR